MLYLLYQPEKNPADAYILMFRVHFPNLKAHKIALVSWSSLKQRYNAGLGLI